jgi:predicted RecB family nuclease
MQRLDGRFIYAASDLNDYLECKRLTELESLVARKELTRPNADEQVQLIRRKGEEHERRHLEALLERYPGEVKEFGRAEAGIENYREAERQTVAAMQRGERIIYQATFFDGRFIGHADFLRRVDEPSNLGHHSYEVIDTKLALETKPYYIVQLCNYSEHLERLQGRLPKYGYIVLGNGEERPYLLNDYMAYYRYLKSRFLEFVGDPAFGKMDVARQYPLKCKHCSICAWNEVCTQKRRDDDHLSLVAWMRRDQIAKFEGSGLTRVTDLAEATDDRRPNGMSPETFAKLRRQASLQVRGRSSARPIYELLEHAPPLGFALLPKPAAGDVFFDMEGDPLYAPARGLEYLFGCWSPDDEPEYRSFWGTDRVAEKRAFEAFVDFIVERRRRYPAMHVYHYADYEKSALRGLAQEHCTREDEIDELLRGEVLVDLFAVVRQALAISEEGYGLKKLERFYDLPRRTDVKKGDESIVMFERWMIEPDRRILDDIEAYNRDDCRSTYLLREWLLQRRAEAVEKFGVDLPLRGVKQPGDPCHVQFEEACSKCVKRRNDEREEDRRTDLERALQTGVLAPQSQEEYRLMNPDKRMRYLLGSLLAYHRREEKPAWWAYYDRCDNVDGLIEFDREAIGGLKLREDIPAERAKNSNVFTYTFPDQLYRMGAGDDAVNPRTQKRAGSIVSLDDGNNLLKLKTTAKIETARSIEELIPTGPPSTKEQRNALARIAQSLLRGNLAQDYPASYDLLSNRNPRVRSTRSTPLQPEHVTAEAVSSVVQALDNSYLFIQGPPGSGKSTIGSHVICDLIDRGKRVAVTSTSHNAIQNLLHKVEACITGRGGHFRGRYKHSGPESEYHSRASSPLIESVDRNEALDGDNYQLAGGTGWLFAREELAGKFDYLFIDEAGQVALADALAVSQCARNVVLLGDPSQLAQVSQGRQPLHAGVSVLQHLLGDAQTVRPDRGIFLDVSYRMQPQICAFISSAMYEHRLQPAQTARLHRVTIGAQDVAGLYFLAMEHTGNRSSSTQEADEIVRRIALLREGGRMVDSLPPETAGVARPIADRDIIVVTPYNAQRRLIADKLHAAGLSVEVGTVDKFQGQEAAVVFYSMATSSGEDVPRDLEFLFERNRFNVAVSRARAVSVLVCSQRLLDIGCRTAEQMALANLLCAFAEGAQTNLPDRTPALVASAS